MSKSLIQLSMKILSCSQKELAQKLGVSPTQITKWKQGEYMSLEMEQKTRNLLNIGSIDPDVIWAFGSVENAQKWSVIITYLANLANESAETGYDNEPLINAELVEILLSQLIDDFSKLGYSVPTQFPKELNFTNENFDDWSEDFIDGILNHPFCNLIWNIFRAFTDIYGFYLAYISYLSDENWNSDSEWDEILLLIDSELISLALIKADTELKLLEKFNNFQYLVRENYQEWLNTIKLKAYKANIPLKAELMHLLYCEHDQLGQEAEAESLGFNDNKLHPDIYMNELLVGMRMIHQVLPVIMKKLEIDDFKLDEEDFKLF